LSQDMSYWFWIIAAFVVTLVVAVIVMKKTKKFGLSFGLSTIVNLLITGGGAASLLLGEADDTTKFKLVVYAIAFFNLVIIAGFVLMSMRGKGNSPVPHKEYED